MANLSDLDLPIALRRQRRSSTTRPRVVSAPLPAILKTPSKPRPKKRVRFSDPGPELSHYEDASLLCSTGLTPMIKRSSLGPPPKRHRGATTARRPASTADVEEDDDSPNEADILSLPQAIDDGGKRRGRRNELSRQTSTAQAKITKPRARKENSVIRAKAEAEVERLRAALADRDAEIERLHNETLVHDTGRIMELEQQIKALRTELAQSQLPTLHVGGDGEDGDVSDRDEEDDLPQSFYDWTLAARDPFSDTYLDGSDDFRDISVTDVACSTPSRRRKTADAPLPRSASASFPTPPCTSPTIPATPCSVRTVMAPATPHSHIGVQTSLPDPEKEALEAELASLRFELTKLTTTLAAHAALEARLSEKLASATSPPSLAEEGESSEPGLEEHLDAVVQQLSERTAAVEELNSSLSSLGFQGTDAGEMIGSITAALRDARLELEYLTPGEITLPLSSHGAQVLDLVLTHLRHLARKVRKDEDTIDEYHALELSLRQQLTARVDAMDSMRAEQKQSAALLRERDAHIADLEVGLERLKGAAEGYRRDIVELEALVQRLEADGKAAEAKLNGEGEGVVAGLEAQLADTARQAAELEARLQELQRRREAETKVRNKSAGAALALRDARVSELRREIYGVNESLRGAHETITRLRVREAALERRAERAEEQAELARAAADTMRAELEKATAAAAAAAAATDNAQTATTTTTTRRRTRSSSREMMTGLATPEPQPGAFLSAGLARSGSGKGRKKRRHDSGLGLLDEDDVELVQ